MVIKKVDILQEKKRERHKVVLSQLRKKKKGMKALRNLRIKYI